MDKQDSVRAVRRLKNDPNLAIRKRLGIVELVPVRRYNPKPAESVERAFEDALPGYRDKLAALRSQ